MHSTTLRFSDIVSSSLSTGPVSPNKFSKSTANQAWPAMPNIDGSDVIVFKMIVFFAKHFFRKNDI